MDGYWIRVYTIAAALLDEQEQLNGDQAFHSARRMLHLDFALDHL